MCDGLGMCFVGGNVSPTRRDASIADARVFPDAGPRDGDLDASDDSGIDGGPGPDTGTDGGFVDGGTPDAGPATPHPDSRGFVWAGELRSGGLTEYHAYAELVDESTATYERRTQSIPDFEAGTCELTVKRLMSGAPTGYIADSITVVPGNPMGPSSVAYLPVGNGRFEPIGMPPARLFSQSPQVLFGIVGTGAAESIQDTGFVRTDAPPIIFEQMPGEGGTVGLAGGPSVAWGASGVLADVVTVEAFDADREVVLTCRTANDGRYSVPPAAAAAFMGEAPTRPWTLEIRHDREATGPAVAGTRSFEVLYRASWGARFSAF